MRHLLLLLVAVALAACAQGRQLAPRSGVDQKRGVVVMGIYTAPYPGKANLMTMNWAPYSAATGKIGTDFRTLRQTHFVIRTFYCGRISKWLRRRVTPACKRTVSFIATSVAPGSYVLRSINLLGPHTTTYYDFKISGLIRRNLSETKAPRFTIRAGEVVYIGTLRIGFRTRTKNGSGALFAVVRRVERHDDDARAFLAKFKNVKAPMVFRSPESE